MRKTVLSDTYVCVTSGVSPMKELGNLSNQISHSSQLPVQQWRCITWCLSIVCNIKYEVIACGLIFLKCHCYILLTLNFRTYSRSKDYTINCGKCTEKFHVPTVIWPSMHTCSIISTQSSSASLQCITIGSSSSSANCNCLINTRFCVAASW